MDTALWMLLPCAPPRPASFPAFSSTSQFFVFVFTNPNVPILVETDFHKNHTFRMCLRACYSGRTLLHGWIQLDSGLLCIDLRNYNTTDPVPFAWLYFRHRLQCAPQTYHALILQGFGWRFPALDCQNYATQWISPFFFAVFFRLWWSIPHLISEACPVPSGAHTAVLRAVAVDFDLELEEDVEEAKNNEDRTRVCAPAKCGVLRTPSTATYGNSARSASISSTAPLRSTTPHGRSPP
ncbi:hypothetical protein B0H14DRAFT_2657254 [Mycena olivaceomarginata]|nr:hypothetical protein B0H14DRAFT_2657254 [Mycena olivaceomarginata]